MIRRTTDPLRQALSAAITRYGLAQAAATEVRRASDRLFERRLDASVAIEKARAVVDEAKKLEPRRVQARLMNEPLPPGPSLAEAEKLLAEAQREHDEGQETDDAALTARLRETEAVVKDAGAEREAAIERVFATSPGALRMVERLEFARAEIAAIEEALMVFHPWLPKPLQLRAKHERRLNNLGVLELWKTAFKALEIDATAPLPTGDEPINYTPPVSDDAKLSPALEKILKEHPDDGAPRFSNEVYTGPGVPEPSPPRPKPAVFYDPTPQPSPFSNAVL